MDWTTETYSLDYLRERAEQWDWGIELSGDYSNASMLRFLVWSEVIPTEVEWRRGNSIPRTNLNGKAIPAGYLAEVAFDYDKDGWSSADDFIKMLEFEVSGTKDNEAVSEVMAELGRMN